MYSACLPFSPGHEKGGKKAGYIPSPTTKQLLGLCELVLNAVQAIRAYFAFPIIITASGRLNSSAQVDKLRDARPVYVCLL